VREAEAEATAESDREAPVGRAQRKETPGVPLARAETAGPARACRARPA